MRIRFAKMQGQGNDFVVIDGVRQRVDLSAERVRALADRHFGVGFDQEDERGKGGLGLINMKERSHIAGGKLTVTSSLGEGTSVVFNLPVAKANA